MRTAMVEGRCAAQADGAADLFLWQADHRLHDLWYVLPHQLTALLRWGHSSHSVTAQLAPIEVCYN